jgi:sodium/potassium-transporting ATPase subunit alpha
MYQFGGFYPSDLIMAFDKWTDGYKGFSQSQLNSLLSSAQCVYFMTLVIMQLGNLFCVRSIHSTVFDTNPFYGQRRNLRIFPAMASALGAALLVVYVPFFNNVFKTGPVPVQFFFMPFGLATGLVCIDEVRKLLLRTFPDTKLAKLAI